MSAETIDPRNNVFYSHSYIFNFGVPSTDTGILAVFTSTNISIFMEVLTRGECYF